MTVSSGASRRIYGVDATPSYRARCAGKKSFTHLRKHRLYARNVLAHLRKLIRLRGLSRGAGHAQIELFTAQLEQLLAEIFGRLRAQVFRLHVRTWRLTKVVDTESFAEARRKPSRAIVSLMPSISTSTSPRSTRATQYSTFPLPPPMRTSRASSA